MDRKFFVTCIFLCGLLSIFTITILAQNTRQSDIEGNYIKVEKGLLSVKLKEVELISTLREISRQARIKVQIDEAIQEKITTEFTGISLEEGLKKLAGKENLVIVYDKITIPSSLENYKLKEIYIFPNGKIPFMLNNTDNSDWKTLRNRKYEYEIKYPSNLIENERETRFLLGSTTVTVFLDEKPSVPLSGTYGGRYSFEENPKAPVSSDIALSQKVVFNGIVFKRDCWIAYGGMGGWDSVINYYIKHKDKYYMISLEHTFSGYIPGEVTAEGKKITKEEIISEILNKMFASDYVRTFNQMFFTFRFLN